MNILSRFQTLVSVVTVFVSVIPAGALLAEPSFQIDIQPYLRAHCIQCHGTEKHESDFRIDELSPSVGQENTAQWAEVMERISSGEMPPKQSNIRPTANESGMVVEWLAARIKEGFPEDSEWHGIERMFNFIWATLYGPGRILEIWLDERSRQLATAHQFERHRNYIRERGLAGWIEAVDDELQIVTITFFDGVESQLFDELTGINEEPHGSGVQPNLKNFAPGIRSCRKLRSGRISSAYRSVRVQPSTRKFLRTTSKIVHDRRR